MFVYRNMEMLRDQNHKVSKWKLQQYTISRVTALLLGLMSPPCTGPGVNLLRLLDDETILYQLPDVLACKFISLISSKIRY